MRQHPGLSHSNPELLREDVFVNLTKKTGIIMIDRKIIEGLLAKKSYRALCRELKVGSRRIAKVEKLALQAGYLDLSVPLPHFPEALFEEKSRSFVPQSDPDQALESHRDWIIERIKAGWHKVTIYEELPVKVGRSSFYRYLDRHKLALPTDSERVVPEIVHMPGEALLLDWGHLCTILCPETAKRRMVWAFVGVLGYSRRMAVRLVWTNSVDITMAAIEEILVELGGVPSRVTSDNPKCFALKADKYQPLLNPAFEMLAQHYGFVIECLPPRDPEKKGKVERPMPFVRRLFEAHGEWLGIELAQEYLDKKIVIANERKHGTTGEKPIARFDAFEKEALKPLPPLRFERQEMAEPIVREDGHVRFKSKYYSVGEGYRGASVVVLGNSQIVRIYFKGNLLTVHDRVRDNSRSKSTKAEHRKVWEKSLEDNAHYLEKAGKIGPNLHTLVQIILTSQHGFVETRMVWGLFHLAKLYERKDFDDACAMAIENHAFSYRDVKRILENTCTPLKSEEKHKHIYTRQMSEYTNHIERKVINHERNDTTRTTQDSAPLDSRAGATASSLPDEKKCPDRLGHPTARTGA